MIKKSDIHLIAYSHEEEVSGYTSYKVNIMDTSKMQNTPPSQHLMKRSFILKNDWLTYSYGISKNAFEESNNDRCVYNQLENILLHPKSGISKKRINGKKVTQESLFEYFQEIIYKYELFNKYPNFTIESGVSAELLSYLCQTIEQNMYGYDANSKCFISVTKFSSKNYSPIVFYKMHEHFYLIDDATCVRSIAETNKHNAKKIISTTIIDEVKKNQDSDLTVTLIDRFDINNVLKMDSGICLLQQSNLNKEIIQFITKYQNVPRSTSKKHSIIQFKFEKGLIPKKKDKEFVIIATDSTYGERYNYENVKKIENENNIQYVNEGLGSVIL